MKIRKAIIPVAGFGTRFLPATKAQPKEMLTLVDKPVIQYIVEEAAAAGIEEIIFITGHNKRAIEDHFDRNFELEYRLKQKKYDKTLKEVLAISDLARFVYVRQKTPLGDGHAVLCAKDLIGNEPCAVLFGDDIIDSKKPTIAEMIKVYEKYQDPVIAVSSIKKEDLTRYGIIEATKLEKNVSQITRLIEKPKPEEAPSNLAIVGRYILTPEVFKAIERAKPSEGGELRLIDGLREILKKRPIYAYEFDGRWYDCGNKLQFMIAEVDFGLKHKKLGKDFGNYLKRLKKSNK